MIMDTATGTGWKSKGKRLINAQKLGFFLIILGLIWGMYLLRLTVLMDGDKKSESDILKKQIIDLSRRYIEALSKEGIKPQDVIKGKISFASGAPGEFKRGTAILLQNMLERIQNLEDELHVVVVNSTLEFAKMSQKIEHLNNTIFLSHNKTGLDDLFIIKCIIPRDSAFPECAAKIAWLQSNWKLNTKYTKNGVNGSLCSMLSYLSQVEHHCPRYFERRVIKLNRASEPPPLEHCDVPKDSAYPQCAAKIEWMKKFWTSDPVYASHGIDGSLCSFIRYLSEVENYCPLLNGRKLANPECKIPKLPAYPACGDKVAWMRKFWKSDKCYTKYGVNGSICSFLIYLSEVEQWCPMMTGRSLPSTPVIPGALQQQPALEQRDIYGLLKKMDDPIPVKFQWIKSRLTRLWKNWVAAQDSLRLKRTLIDYPRKKVLIYIGLLGDENLYHFAAGATLGGPLGELLQWSDTIAALYLLGHDLTISADKEKVKSTLKRTMQGNCPSTEAGAYDIIYTDYIGLVHFARFFGNLGSFKCHLRVVDSFGTEAQFNYVTDPKIKSVYGSYNLNLKQFNTMFPHSPDNTFLGFVVENHVKPEEKLIKKPIALVYGKHASMWENAKKIKFLDVVQKYFEVHATVGGKPKEQVKLSLPRYVINHGVLGGEAIQQLLKETTLFVGLGFPFEGPAPLEAIANGCFFLNAELHPPLNRDNSPFFKPKPTFRKLTSQHPYAARYIGKPHVYTLDITNLKQVEEAIIDMKNHSVSPYLPKEFTFEGMLERLYAFTKHHDFCNNRIWPPSNSSQVFAAGGADQSCKDVCEERGLICEPAYFETINNKKTLMDHKLNCQSFEFAPSLVAPGIKLQGNNCLLQSEKLMYSCTAKSPSAKRLCPCRDFVRGQTAFCKGCV